MFGRPKDPVRCEAERVARQARPNFHVSFTRELAALCLWDYGEDALSDRALSLSDDDLQLAQRVAAVYEDSSCPLPITRQRILGGHVIAFSVMTVLEGLRPLARTRRRPAKHRPAHLA